MSQEKFLDRNFQEDVELLLNVDQLKGVLPRDVYRILLESDSGQRASQLVSLDCHVSLG